MSKKKKVGMFDEVNNTVTPTDGIKSLVFNPNTHVFKLSAVGNIKLGKILSFSKLLGNYIYKRLTGVLKNIVGSCGNCEVCKRDCYVRSSYRFPCVIFSQAINTWGMRHAMARMEQDFAKQLRKSKIGVVRINQSGELESLDELAMWCRLAMANPTKKFYVYTKNYGVATEALKTGIVPSNFTILFSVWHDVGVKEYESVKEYENVKAFVYDDGQLSIKPDTYCMAYQNGKLNHEITCEKCMKCYNNALKRKVIGCKEH